MVGQQMMHIKPALHARNTREHAHTTGQTRIFETFQTTNFIDKFYGKKDLPQLDLAWPIARAAQAHACPLPLETS